MSPCSEERRDLFGDGRPDPDTQLRHDASVLRLIASGVARREAAAAIADRLEAMLEPQVPVAEDGPELCGACGGRSTRWSRSACEWCDGRGAA